MFAPARNFDLSKAFYVALGWRIKWDGGKLALMELADHRFQWVRDIDTYYSEIVDRGADAAGEPRNQPYGIREFSVRDVNGVGIVFGQHIELR